MFPQDLYLAGISPIPSSLQYRSEYPKHPHVFT
nr:MAG TPA: hypothetical protein [Caudoviricetes sp.]